MDRGYIEEIISRRLCGIETALPGIVTNVASDGTLAVKALIQKVTVDGVVDIENVAIEGVKPFTFGNGSVEVSLAIEKGSQVLLVGISRHASEWFSSKSDEPIIPRSFVGNTMNDLFALPISRRDRENGKKSKISLDKDGGIELCSTYGQTIRLVEDGSIELNPKSGCNVKVNGGIEATMDVVANSSIRPVSLTTHIHGSGVGPTTPPQ